jgi:hypothetical protein
MFLKDYLPKIHTSQRKIYSKSIKNFRVKYVQVQPKMKIYLQNRKEVLKKNFEKKFQPEPFLNLLIIQDLVSSMKQKPTKMLKTN